MWYFWEKNSIVRFQKSFWDIAHDVRHLLIGCQVNTDAWFKWLMFRTYREYFKLQVYGDLSPVRNRDWYLGRKFIDGSTLPSVTTEG